ncbi:DNA-binding response OmpR family regulator [Flavobacterium sp. 7E]|uniref:response regulator transcription factor n=1 Tax=unclassified Flavobacterium TaxID=196869 RepID=UPI00156E4F31|nr:MULTISPECIES: response regulator transcription factor [unclassified Flavobacterium]NRS89951.1 DNA-binding response OmpR family regulator [Flavobacterium sp. 7E]NRT16774.1 DNA-binding response OmpR family regulator [Flavobacterium sp. 28A]
MKKILMIEDDPSIVELASIHLKDIHCELTKAYNGFEGLHLANTNSYDAIILDIMLPDIDGIEICKRIRAEKNFTPIMMLTARSEEIDKIIGLETGADDYLTKPFSIREFTARVKALIRRSEINSTEQVIVDEVLQCGNLQLDTQKRKVLLEDQKIELTPKEFDLLYLFMSNPGISYSRETLLNLVWGYEFSGYEHTVNSHINRLRTKIEPNLTNPKYILTTWGIGYRFTDEIK